MINSVKPTVHKYYFPFLLKDMCDCHGITMNLVVLGVLHAGFGAHMCAGAQALVPIGRSIQLDPDCTCSCGGCFPTVFIDSNITYEVLLVYI